MTTSILERLKDARKLALAQDEQCDFGSGVPDKLQGVCTKLNCIVAEMEVYSDYLDEAQYAVLQSWITRIKGEAA